MNRRQRDMYDPAADYRAKGLETYSALYRNCMRVLEKHDETEKSLNSMLAKLEAKIDADGEVADLAMEVKSMIEEMKAYREAMFYTSSFFMHIPGVTTATESLITTSGSAAVPLLKTVEGKGTSTEMVFRVVSGDEGMQDDNTKQPPAAGNSTNVPPTTAQNAGEMANRIKEAMMRRMAGQSVESVPHAPMTVTPLQIRETEQYSPLQSQFMQSHSAYQEYDEPVIDSIDYEVGIQRTDGMGPGNYGTTSADGAEGSVAALEDKPVSRVRSWLDSFSWSGQKIRISRITNTK
ncbi:hypothetical protein BC830DRAFT_1173298 [Chytriomyces sp. MP71]|nr:hypothetical protein BC830DRAFT_1173298 [Chytriomyces sp. MP71]